MVKCQIQIRDRMNTDIGESVTVEVTVPELARAAVSCAQIFLTQPVNPGAAYDVRVGATGGIEANYKGIYWPERSSAKPELCRQPRMDVTYAAIMAQTRKDAEGKQLPGFEPVFNPMTGLCRYIFTQQGQDTGSKGQAANDLIKQLLEQVIAKAGLCPVVNVDTLKPVVAATKATARVKVNIPPAIVVPPAPAEMEDPMLMEEQQTMQMA